MKDDVFALLACLQLPAWSVIVLGCYALYCIGLGLYNFGDPGSAAEDLAKVREITTRKASNSSEKKN